MCVCVSVRVIVRTGLFVPNRERAPPSPRTVYTATARTVDSAIEARPLHVPARPCTSLHVPCTSMHVPARLFHIPGEGIFHARSAVIAVQRAAGFDHVLTACLITSAT